MELNNATAHAGGNSISRSVVNRIAKIANTSSNGIPPEFESPFEWAASWVEQHGMTLPPDTNELRSLRNWFCYKLNQYKKRALGPRNEALLALHGLDFSKYEALNTGRGDRESDAPYIEQMQSWCAEHTTYDLDATAPAKLIQWQWRLIDRYCAEGPSGRMKDIQNKLPGLHFGLWRKPGEAPWPLQTRQWWQQASQFELAAQTCHPFRGELHPGTPAELAQWARQQQRELTAGAIVGRQRGWMVGIGLLINNSRIKVGREREQELIDFRGGEDAIARYGHKDKRLNSILGALLAVRLVMRGASDQEICTELVVSPIVAMEIRAMVGKKGALFTFSDLRKALTDCRMICLNDASAFSPAFWKRMRADGGQNRPAALTDTVETLGNLAYALMRKFRNAQTDTKAPT